MEVGAPGGNKIRVPKAVTGGVSGAPVPFPAVDRPTDEQARELGFVDAMDWYRKSTKSSVRGSPIPDVEYRSLPPAVVDPDDVEFEVPPSHEALMISWEDSGRYLRDCSGGTPSVAGESEQIDNAEKLRILLAHEDRMRDQLGIDRPYLLLDVETRSALRAE